ncbi:MAG TPA: hypothetical protein VHJ17_02050 [Thermomonospora sp.]|nr:hypothetical protein [Thermomonospora sp.]
MRTHTQAPTWADRFLADLARHGYVAKAARTAGISCSVVTRRCRTNPAFAADVAEAMGDPPAEAREISYPHS